MGRVQFSEVTPKFLLQGGGQNPRGELQQQNSGLGPGGRRKKLPGERGPLKFGGAKKGICPGNPLWGDIKRKPFLGGESGGKKLFFKPGVNTPVWEEFIRRRVFCEYKTKKWLGGRRRDKK